MVDFTLLDLRDPDRIKEFTVLYPISKYLSTRRAHLESWKEPLYMLKVARDGFKQEEQKPNVPYLAVTRYANEMFRNYDKLLDIKDREVEALSRCIEEMLIEAEKYKDALNDVQKERDEDSQEKEIKTGKKKMPFEPVKNFIVKKSIETAAEPDCIRQDEESNEMKLTQTNTKRRL